MGKGLNLQRHDRWSLLTVSNRGNEWGSINAVHAEKKIFNLLRRLDETHEGESTCRPSPHGKAATAFHLRSWRVAGAAEPVTSYDSRAKRVKSSRQSPLLTCRFVLP